MQQDPLRADPLADTDYITKREQRLSGGAVRPRDSAILILVRRDGRVPRILMGKRSAKHVFMPNKYVFPGGKVERADGRLMVPNELNPMALSRLLKGCSETRARALALAAIRETYEETGLVVGNDSREMVKSRSPAWKNFLRHGINPCLSKLYYVARAITPPYRNRRFDARFFMADISDLTLHDASSEASGELSEIHWVSISSARELELPHITRVMLDEIEQFLREGFDHSRAAPFIYARYGKFVNDRH